MADIDALKVSSSYVESLSIHKIILYVFLFNSPVPNVFPDVNNLPVYLDEIVSLLSNISDNLDIA